MIYIYKHDMRAPHSENVSNQFHDEAFSCFSTIILGFVEVYRG